MMCKAREALKAGIEALSYLHPQTEDGCVVDNALEQMTAALKAHDCVPREVAEQAQEALQALEWLPEDQGDWAECPCCGQRRFDGHLDGECQLEQALAALNKALAPLTEALEERA